MLAASLHEVEVERPSVRTLVLRPEGGFLLPRGRVPAGHEQPAFSLQYAARFLDSNFRDERLAFALGERFERRRLRIEVTALTEDGRPAEATFHFAVDLEDESWVFLHFQEGRYVPWNLPRIGESTNLPSLL